MPLRDSRDIGFRSSSRNRMKMRTSSILDMCNLKCLWHIEIETTKKVEIRSRVVENVLTENRDLESLLYSKVSETPRNNTQRVKKRDKKKRPMLRSWVIQQIRGKVKNR